MPKLVSRQANNRKRNRSGTPSTEWKRDQVTGSAYVHGGEQEWLWLTAIRHSEALAHTPKPKWYNEQKQTDSFRKT